MWQAEVGTAALPWLVDHQVNNVAAMPGAAFCEMALAAARTALGDGAEVRDVRFERMLLLENETAVSAEAVCAAPGHAASSSSRPIMDGERERRASAVLRDADAAETARGPTTWMRCSRRTRAAPTAPRSGTGSIPAVCSSARRSQALAAVNAAEDAGDTVLAEIGLPIGDPQSAERLRRAPGSAGCLLPVGRRPSGRAEHRHRRPAAAAGCASPACLRPGQQGPLLPDPGRLTGRVRRRGRHLRCSTTTAPCLLAVDGLSMGTGNVRRRPGAQRAAAGRRVAQAGTARAGPARRPRHLAAGQHLGLHRSAGLRTHRRAQAQRCRRRRRCPGRSTPTTPPTPSGCGPTSAEGRFGNMVVVAAPRNGCPPEQLAQRGGEHVRHLVRIVRDLPEVAGEPPRLYVVTRGAQTVLAGRAAQSRAGRPAWPAAGDRCRAPASAADPDRRRRGDRGHHRGPAAAARVGGGRDRLPQRRVVHRAPVPEPAAARGALHHRRGPRAATACGWRSGPRATCRRWS